MTDFQIPAPAPQSDPEPAPLLRWALIRGGAVFTIVDQADEPALPDTGAIELEPGQMVNPGDHWDVDAFTRPAAARHITQLAFQQRFTDAEAIAIDLASIGATVPAATVRRYLALVQAARYIDLDRADTRAGVQALEVAGLLSEGRADEILDAVVQPQERP